MNTYLLSCDFNNPERDYSTCYKEMQKYTALHCFDSTWLIKTNETIDEVETNLLSKKGPFESMIICKVEMPIRGSLSTLQWDWVEENL